MTPPSVHRQTALACLIGGGFGLDFVLPNAGAPLARAAAEVLRVGSVALFAALLLSIALNWRRSRRARRSPGASAGRGRNLFGAGYWLVVVAEVALIAGGRAAVAALHGPQQLDVAWTALVVGLHFVAFAAFGVWGGAVRTLGLTLATLGATGVALSLTPAVVWVPLTSGVTSGFALLVGSLHWNLRDLAKGQPHRGYGHA